MYSDDHSGTPESSGRTVKLHEDEMDQTHPLEEILATAAATFQFVSDGATPSFPQNPTYHKATFSICRLSSSDSSRDRHVVALSDNEGCKVLQIVLEDVGHFVKLSRLQYKVTLNVAETRSIEASGSYFPMGGKSRIAVLQFSETGVELTVFISMVEMVLRLVGKFYVETVSGSEVTSHYDEGRQDQAAELAPEPKRQQTPRIRRVSLRPYTPAASNATLESLDQLLRQCLLSAVAEETELNNDGNSFPDSTFVVLKALLKPRVIKTRSKVPFLSSLSASSNDERQRTDNNNPHRVALRQCNSDPTKKLSNGTPAISLESTRSESSAVLCNEHPHNVNSEEEPEEIGEQQLTEVIGPWRCDYCTFYNTDRQQYRCTVCHRARQDAWQCPSEACGRRLNSVDVSVCVCKAVRCRRCYWINTMPGHMAQKCNKCGYSNIYSTIRVTYNR